MSAPDRRIPARLHRYFPTPLADWDNDDLLLTSHAQQTVQAAYPAAFRVLDWPELREAFSKHDKRANAEKKKINHHGMWGALLTTLGASLIAFAPLVPAGWPQKSVVIPGCALVVLGGLIGLSHLYLHDARNGWLIERIWTERLRQFYFQYILQHFSEALAAMEDDAKQGAYYAARQSLLEAFQEKLQVKLSAGRKRSAINKIANDDQDADLWGQASWCHEPSVGGMSETESLSELMECLHYRRIEIQGIYAENNLIRGANSPGGMAAVAETLSDLLIAVFVIALFFAGIAVLRHPAPGTPSLEDVLIAVSGIAAAWSLFFRLLDQGMGYSLDAERYELYVSQLAVAKQRFEDSDSNVLGKILALRQVEVHAYREMRQFLRTHIRSRFI